MASILEHDLRIRIQTVRLGPHLNRTVFIAHWVTICFTAMICLSHGFSGSQQIFRSWADIDIWVLRWRARRCNDVPQMRYVATFQVCSLLFWFEFLVRSPLLGFSARIRTTNQFFKLPIPAASPAHLLMNSYKFQQARSYGFPSCSYIVCTPGWATHPTTAKQLSTRANYVFFAGLLYMPTTSYYVVAVSETRICLRRSPTLGNRRCA